MVASDPNPAPRPALRRASDGAVHPASPRLATLQAQIQAELDAPPPSRQDSGDKKPKSGTRKPGKKDAARRGADGERLVDVVVSMPKPMRAALREKAADTSMTAEEMAYQVLRIWLYS